LSDPPVPNMDVVQAVTGRRSIRRFLPNPVSEECVAAILQAASRAPSGTNIQPWLVHVVTGEARDRLSRDALEAAEAEQTSLEYAYQPEVWKEPYLSRRRKIGFDLHAIYGIERGDMAARKASMLQNFSFFGAPVGLFITMERDMALGAWLDCGMFMQNIMTVARGYGLETCPQQAWCDFGAVVHRALDIPDEHIILSGMALGYADHTAPVNTLSSDRIGVAEFTTWHRSRRL
jgi:nitroreductase